jgi:hypothetical protein
MRCAGLSGVGCERRFATARSSFGSKARARTLLDETIVFRDAAAQHAAVMAAEGTVQATGRTLGRAFGALVASFAVVACGAAAADDEPASAYVVPRTPWGDPDLRGMWPIDHVNGTPLQRPAELGEQRYLSDEDLAEREARLAALNARYDEEGPPIS